MKSAEILKAIAFGNLSNDELNQIANAVKYARQQLARDVRVQLRIGDSVKFRNRAGLTVTGNIQKINVKTVMVRTSGTLWRVPANMLEVA